MPHRQASLSTSYYAEYLVLRKSRYGGLSCHRVTHQRRCDDRLRPTATQEHEKIHHRSGFNYRKPIQTHAASLPTKGLLLRRSGYSAQFPIGCLTLSSIPMGRPSVRSCVSLPPPTPGWFASYLASRSLSIRFSSVSAASRLSASAHSMAR